MDIESYTKSSPQYYTGMVPKVLEKYLNSLNEYEHILDCGCGDGSILFALKTNGFLKNREVTAVDISRERVDLVKLLDSRIKARVDNAEELKTVKTSSVDFVISTQVIEHVDDKKMVATLGRILKKNGLVYISTVFKKWYGWYFYRKDGAWVLDPTHLREYITERDLIDIFTKSGFRLEYNGKKMQWFPIADFFLKHIGGKVTLRYRTSLFWKLLRSIRLPIVGYYEWELVFRKV
ncbi:MAG: class I SAM-dependent methyltransferase [Patescibacteria group bacterium]